MTLVLIAVAVAEARRRINRVIECKCACACLCAWIGLDSSSGQVCRDMNVNVGRRKAWKGHDVMPEILVCTRADSMQWL